MFYSNGASRRLSEDLRSLVHQNFSESKQGAAGTANDRGASKSQIRESSKDLRKGIYEPALQDEFGRPTWSPMLDSLQGTALAARLLAKLQSQADALFQIDLHYGEGFRSDH